MSPHWQTNFFSNISHESEVISAERRIVKPKFLRMHGRAWLLARGVAAEQPWYEAGGDMYGHGWPGAVRFHGVEQ
jgi:hypothetical protein